MAGIEPLAVTGCDQLVDPLARKLYDEPASDQHREDLFPDRDRVRAETFLRPRLVGRPGHARVAEQLPGHGCITFVAGRLRRHDCLPTLPLTCDAGPDPVYKSKQIEWFVDTSVM